MDDLTWGWLEAALERGREAGESREAVETQIAANHAQLWRGETGALVTQLVRGPEGLFVHCWLGGGRLAGCLELRPGVEAWGRQMGADFASINGRRGWGRIFRRYGYARRGDDLVKSLRIRDEL